MKTVLIIYLPWLLGRRTPFPEGLYMPHLLQLKYWTSPYFSVTLPPLIFTKEQH